MSVDIHALSGPYALDAVDDVERARFERHLADCGTCRAEVDSLREAAALLPATSEQTPPAHLRASVLAGIANVRPLPPVVVAVAERQRATRRRFPALVAAAVALIAIGGAGATVWHPWDESDPTRGSVVLAADAVTYETELRDGGTATVVRSKSRNQAVLSTNGLAPLESGETYVLWLIHDRRYVNAGSMDGDASSVVLDGDPASATAAGITVETSADVDRPNLMRAVVIPFKRA